MLGSPKLHKLKSLTRYSFFLWNAASTSAEIDISCIGYSCPRVPCQFLGCSLRSRLTSPPTLFYLSGKGTVWLESTLIGRAQTAPVTCEFAYILSNVALSSWSSHLEDPRADSGLQDARHRACPCYQWWLFACLSLWETERNLSPLHTSLRCKVTFLTIVRM